ncbi:MAG TPA: DUF6531 domain-containing protein [Solirubrobacteraceae bacterium]|nr:DUF6531 domain-containing protein [Solirubrobacteraceae bacterium]
MSSLLLRSVRLLLVLGCSVAVVLVVGVAPASAVKVSEAEKLEAEAHYESFHYHPEAREQATEVCSGGTCVEGPKSVVPPGEYLESSLAGFGAIRVHEFEERWCSNAEKDEGCTVSNKERPEKSFEYLASKYTELYQTIHSGNLYEDGIHSLSLIYVYAWRPTKRRHGPRRRERFGLRNAADMHVQDPCKGEPVDCATGNDVESQTDLRVPALGVPFGLERTYNSQAAVEASSPGLFGYGWTSSFSDHLEFDSETNAVTVVQANGSTAVFFGPIGTPGEFAAPGWSQAKLVYTSESTYKFTLPDQETFTFNSSGRLLSESERNGNTTTVTYNEEEVCEGGCHKVLKSIVITDPVSRKITLTVNSGGQVESATDPMGHVVKYGYEGGGLVSVTEPGESSPRWRYKYNSAHEMTEMINGLGGTTTNEYNEAHEVVSQTSPLGDKLKFGYENIASKEARYAWSSVGEEEPEEEVEEVAEPVESERTFYAPPEQETTITNESTGAVEREHFNSEDELATVTRAAGTANETTESLSYNSDGELTKRTDGNKHTTEYGYDAGGDLTSEKDPDGDETKREYNSTHDLTGVTEPNGEKTTIERDSHGNALVISRPAPKEETQSTKYKYKSDGELETMTDPLGHESKYEYDSYGDRTGETDPEGNKRTWEYNEDSHQTATVTPRGNAKGAEPAKFKTTTELNAQGLPLKITDPLGHTTEYKYNADGDVESVADANKHTTSYSYNNEDEPVQVKEPSGGTTETEYDKTGQVIAQIDGNKHKTKYKRNVLEQITESTDPLGHLTTKEYDGAGNLVKLTDPAKRTTSYTYDPANRLTEVTYSDGKTPTVKYEYNKDGDRTKMTDGTGTTTNTFDQLDRLTETENGNKETVKYEYNLANDQTKITYPNGKAVTRAFDKDDRLEKVTDWSANLTKFTYNPDSQLATTVFPTATKDEDGYAYNDADQMTEVKMGKGSETLASLVYTRDNDGQVKKTTAKKLPGTEATEATYDEDNRGTKYGTTEYKYDAANSPTKLGATTQTFNEGDELEKAATTSYSFDELGERTKQTPEKGPATTYGYNQSSELTSAERPKEGSTPEIKDTYAYNGEDLRISQTISGTTNYLAWDMAEELPLILSDGTNSYIYAAAGPIEQINNTTGTVTYLHHDQAGSTRLLTGSTGTVTGKCTYNAYGTPTCEGTGTTPLGYDGQYTSSDTGLIYLRNRVYDPATAQFLTVDPLVSISGAPYSYAGDNPLTYGDAVGLLWTPLAGGAGGADAACGATIEIPGVDIGTCGAAGISTGIAAAGAAIGVFTAVAGNEGGDEGEAELKKKEAERENCGNPASPPGSKFEWKGKGPEGSSEGSWWDPDTRESLHPDLGHEEPIGPHYDYTAPDGSEYRIYSDGRIEPTNP